MNFSKWNTLAKITFVLLIMFFGGLKVFAEYYSVAHVFENQQASSRGSNNSLIYVGPSITGWNGDLTYINRGNNSSIIDNYFTGYYYDTLYGYFKVDYLATMEENVRVVSSYSGCGTWYGYKLGGYAYSEYYGFVDFDFNSSVFVYYCETDSSLHGYAYSDTLGFQSFEGIDFPIEVTTSNTPIVLTSNTSFTNDSSTILTNSDSNSSQNNGQIDPNYSDTTIQTFQGSFEPEDDSMFYIIK